MPKYSLAIHNLKFILAGVGLAGRGDEEASLSPLLILKPSYYTTTEGGIQDGYLLLITACPNFKVQRESGNVIEI